VRTHAARAFLQAGPEPASSVPGLVDSLQDELDLVRFHAAVALGDLGREARAAVPALIHLHQWDSDPAVRVEAAIALWKIDHKSAIAIPALIKGLAEENEFICWMAADCLGRIGPEAEEAIPALEQALERKFRLAVVRRGIRAALERIGPMANEALSHSAVSGSN
jgi:HEAT repeat protein